MCQFCCCIDFFIRCIQLAITDIITNRTGKQMCVLKNDSKRMSQIILFDLGNIDSIITDLAFLDIIKTIDQIGYGCLTGSGRADECQFLSGLRIQADIVKNCFVFIISKGYILKSYITFQLCIGYGAICRMRMFPCPHAGSLFAFYNVAILIFSCIDKCYITLILFWFLIDQIENSFRTGKRHDDGIKLLCHLHERLSEAFGELQIGSHNTKCDSSDACYRKDSSENRRQYKLQVSDISDNWSHHITVFICL